MVALEIVCDESGFAGGNLVGPGHSPVFAHASLTISADRATTVIAALRANGGPGSGEFKATRLKQAPPAAVMWLLTQPELAAGRGLVQLIDTRLFVLARTVDVLLGDRPVSGIDTPGATPELRTAAQTLHRASRQAGADQPWTTFLVAAANLLRTHNRWLPPDPLPRFTRAIDELAATEPDPECGAVLDRLHAAEPRAVEIRAALEADRRAAPLMEPLVPALMRAIEVWAARTDRLTVVHDEQSALTPWRIAEMEARLVASGSRGRLAAVRRVDSRDDVRVQVADVVAGLARRWALAALGGRSDPVASRLRPLVDDRSLWCP